MESKLYMSNNRNIKDHLQPPSGLYVNSGAFWKHILYATEIQFSDTTCVKFGCIKFGNFCQTLSVCTGTTGWKFC